LPCLEARVEAAFRLSPAPLRPEEPHSVSAETRKEQGCGVEAGEDDDDDDDEEEACWSCGGGPGSAAHLAGRESSRELDDDAEAHQPLSPLATATRRGGGREEASFSFSFSSPLPSLAFSSFSPPPPCSSPPPPSLKNTLSSN